MGRYALMVAWLGEAYLLAGRLDESMPCAERALTLAHTHQERGHEAWALRLLGEVQAKVDTAAGAQATTYYQQALALAQELGRRPLQAHCQRGIGSLYVKMGCHELAQAELSAALDLYRAMEMTLWVPQTEAALEQAEQR